MNGLEQLKQIRELLNKPEHWTQNASARDNFGKHVDSRSPSAVCWCLSGAISKITSDPTVARGLEKYQQLNKTLVAHANVKTVLSEWNDRPHRRHEDILLVLDDTIKRLETT